VDVLAIGLGIGGVVQSNRKKIFAVLGIVFAAITIVLTVVLMVIGNLM
jgi:t-SNARE complex subunit (syntaxin)